MKTSYITTLTTRFNPFARSSKVPRLLLSLIGPAAQKTVKINTTQLPKASAEPAMLEVGFKDGKMMKWAWDEQGTEVGKQEQAGVQDVVEEVDRHARMLKRKEDLNG